MEPKYAIVFVWFVWLASWLAATSWAKPTVKTPARWSEFPYRLLQGLGFAMVFASLGQSQDYSPEPNVSAKVLSFLFTQLWELPWAGGWVAVLLALGGLAFAWWARLHLGTLWSSSVTRKEDHTIIDTGPYGFVRHPIYTGLLLGTIALAAVSGRLLAVIGLVAVAVGIFIKARLEERFLSAELGAEAYAAYRKRVPMLIPGSPV
ncbi:MAG: isoprenylcysteine carboxylmethyltransferase family protein [Alphaproteobacteria bacterium]|nr:isoprenylcysteine carboxylmethyltransferase family protein [Alphaproteobacteria bacterium]